MWHGRFTQNIDATVLKFSQSLDLDWRMVQCDIRGSIAHVRMLGKVGIVKPDEAKEIENGLIKVAKEAASGEYLPKESLEDVHMNVEARLTEILGDVGAKLHAGRSRNDQANVTVRLALRMEILDIWKLYKPLLETLLDKADEHKDKIVPGYTHMQQAQPISMGQFWMAYYQMFLRDAKRLHAAYDFVDECTLGTGAIAGSTLLLDREFTAKDLGFSRISENSMDSVASRDHISEFHHFASMFGMHASRISEDLIIYFTSEFGWVLLPDAFCTGSSMMPQKKNPDVLELIRGKAGQLIGGYVDAVVMQKGTPLTFNRDFQEDKRSMWRSCEAIRLILDVMPPMLSAVEIDEGRARRDFGDGFIFATDVAEHLVSRGVPFRTAHEMTGHLVQWCIENKRSLTSLTPTEWKEHMPQVDCEMIGSLLTPDKSVGRRNTYGGTSSKQVEDQIARGKIKLKSISDEFSRLADKYPKLPA